MSANGAAPLDHEPTEPAIVTMTPRAVHRMHAANRRDRREAVEARQRKDAKGARKTREKAEAEAAEIKAQADRETAVVLALCVPGSMWRDANGRQLIIEEVSPGDPLGRQVVGVLQSAEGEPTRPYSTTLMIWQELWHDKAAPWVGTI